MQPKRCLRLFWNRLVFDAIGRMIGIIKNKTPQQFYSISRVKSLKRVSLGQIINLFIQFAIVGITFCLPNL